MIFSPTELNVNRFNGCSRKNSKGPSQLITAAAVYGNMCENYTRRRRRYNKQQTSRTAQTRIYNFAIGMPRHSNEKLAFTRDQPPGRLCVVYFRRDQTTAK